MSARISAFLSRKAGFDLPPASNSLTPILPRLGDFGINGGQSGIVGELSRGRGEEVFGFLEALLSEQRGAQSSERPRMMIFDRDERTPKPLGSLPILTLFCITSSLMDHPNITGKQGHRAIDRERGLDRPVEVLQRLGDPQQPCRILRKAFSERQPTLHCNQPGSLGLGEPRPFGSELGFVETCRRRGGQRLLGLGQLTEQALTPCLAGIAKRHARKSADHGLPARQCACPILLRFGNRCEILKNPGLRRKSLSRR